MKRDTEWDGLGGLAAVRMREVIARDPNFAEIGPLLDMVVAVEAAANAFSAKAQAAGVSNARVSALVAIALLQTASRSCRLFSEAETGRFQFDRLALAAQEMDEGAGSQTLSESLLREELSLFQEKADSEMASLLAAAEHP